MLNDYSYNNQIVSLLASSKLFGLTMLVLSLVYFMFIHLSFIGISVKMTSLLLFPTIMLAVDAVFLWLSSIATERDILCYYNQNINEIPPTYKLELIHTIVASAIRAWHYYNLFRLFFKEFLEKIEFLDCMWILSVINAGYLSISTLAKSLHKYRSYNKLIEKMNKIFKKNESTPDQICIICMDQLLNCRRLIGCGHLFHYKCLFQWVQTKYECPVCRVPINLNF